MDRPIASLEPHVVRAAFLRSEPWANGGGLTRVIGAVAGAWRLSLATIAGPGPFSHLPGVARHFAVLAGRVGLEANRAPFPIECDALSPVLAFPGDLAIEAAPRAGPVLALNLMVPSGAPGLRLVRGVVAAPVAVFACAPVDVVVNGRTIALEPHDTLFAQGCAVTAPAEAALLTVAP